MKLDEFILSRHQILNNFNYKGKMWQEDIMMAKFNIVSALLSNYLPSINYAEHERIFKQIVLHQELSIFEQNFFDLPDYVTYENYDAEKLILLKKGGNIICTFHTGSYRLINLFLAKNDIPYTLILAKEAYEKQGETFNKIFEKLNEDRAEKLDFRLLNAESAASAIQMIREIKSGRNLVIYIDGNSGAGTETISNQNHCEINFLGQKIYARRGIAYLANALKIPIIPVASYRKTISDIRIKFFDTIFPDTNQDKKDATETVTKQIFNLISPIIERYPEQWEPWLYLEKVASISSPDVEALIEKTMLPNLDDKIVFNFSSFGIFKVFKQPFLFKKSNYKSYKISYKVYTQLAKCMVSPVKIRDIDIPELNELYDNKVLISP